MAKNTISKSTQDLSSLGTETLQRSQSQANVRQTFLQRDKMDFSFKPLFLLWYLMCVWYKRTISVPAYLVARQLPDDSGSSPDEEAQRRGQVFTSERRDGFPASTQTPQFQFRPQEGHVEIFFAQRKEYWRGQLKKSRPDVHIVTQRINLVCMCLKSNSRWQELCGLIRLFTPANGRGGALKNRKMKCLGSICFKKQHSISKSNNKMKNEGLTGTREQKNNQSVILLSPQQFSYLFKRQDFYVSYVNIWSCRTSSFSH